MSTLLTHDGAHAPLEIGPVPSGPQGSHSGSGRKNLKAASLWALVFFPTVFAMVYYGFLASNRFVSEAQFVVRSAAKPIASSGFGSFLQMAGLSRSNDDAFSVQSFISSREAIESLDQKISLREIYGRPEADALSRFPSLLFGTSKEHLHQYMASMVETSFSSTTGITTMTVEAFRPEDAQSLSVELLQLAEQAVNQMNIRINEDAVRVARETVKRQEDRIIAAQIKLTQFRNSELMIDPASSSIIVTELAGRLSAEVAGLEAQLRETEAASPESPALPSMRRRIAALNEQIKREREKIAGNKDGLAGKLAEYERLVLEREFAKEALATAVKALEQATLEAQRQQLYLQNVVKPVLSDYPIEPRRVRMIFTIFGLNLVGCLIVWLFYAGLRAHSRTV